MYRYFIIILFICFTVIQLNGCSKFVELEPASGIVPTKLVFENEQTALSAVGGVYIRLTTNSSVFSNSGLSRLAGLLADDLVAPASNPNIDPFFQNNLNATNGQVSSAIYNPAYQIIYSSTAVIEGLENSQTIPESSKKQMLGEMLAIRSLVYSVLVQLFGDVPLVVSTDYRINAQLPRASVQAVLLQLEKDLQRATEILQEKYPSTGKLRINKHAASAMLARVFLLAGKWSKAENAATSVIGSSMYQINNSGNLSQVFLKNSPETLWEVAPASDVSVPGDASQFLPANANALPNYVLSPTMFDSFEQGDVRKRDWIGKNTVNGSDYYYPRKYRQQSNAGGPPNEYQIVLRIPDLYLLRAEARAQQNSLPDALSDLNLIRVRAGLSPLLSFSEKTALLSRVQQERRVEFFAEWGHRWFDLKRFGNIDQVLSIVKGANWSSTDALLPFPETELLANPFLHQNPGY